jgi:hypothetical protein
MNETQRVFRLMLYRYASVYEVAALLATAVHVLPIIPGIKVQRRETPGSFLPGHTCTVHHGAASRDSFRTWLVFHRPQLVDVFDSTLVIGMINKERKMEECGCYTGSCDCQ